MNHRPLTLLCLSTVAANLLITPVSAQDSPSGPPFATPGEAALTKAFMRQKLAYSQNVLEGLTLEKFEMVTVNARLLRDMTQSNLFLRVGNPEYLKQTKSFVRSVDQLIIGAEEQDLKDATKALNKVTSSCVECHRWFRTEQHGARSKPKAPVLLLNPAGNGK